MELLGPNGAAIQYQRDQLGYPSVRAANLSEGTYALGYLHATDRLTQVTFTALAARGELMSVLGDVPFARLIDRSTRALGLTADVAEQAARCDPESLSLLADYSAGFNAGAKARGTPLVLRMLGVEPFSCSAESVLAIFRFVTYFGLTSMQVSTELIIAELVARGAPARLFERLLGLRGTGLDLEALRGLEIPQDYSFFLGNFGSTQAGSNAFAVDKEHSESGAALLMGEFHMEVGRNPPLLYAAHLGFENGEYLTGLTIPGMAWFAAGRTRHVGWSYTFAHADNVDLLVEEVADGKYRVGGELREFHERVEQVRIKNQPSETWTFYANEYGTLLGDAKSGKRVCARVSGLSETHRAFSAARRVLDCKTVAELAEVQREVRSASLEAIMVDRDGAIGSIVTGQVDQRPIGWSGAYPIPGWQLDDAERRPEPVAEALRPVALGPDLGTLASANQGGQGPNVARFCSFPEPLYRFERIKELLAARERHSLNSLLAISYDTFDGSARRLLPVWKPLLPAHPEARALCDWARTQKKDVKRLALFHKLYEETCFALLERDIPRAAARRFREWSALAFFQPQLDSLLALEQLHLLDEAELRALLAVAFPAALNSYETSEEIPVKLRFRHTVTQGRTPSFLGFDSKTVTLPGSPVTPFQCRISPISGEKLVYAPAFHVLFDMSQDHVFYNLPGGASESRFGPGYGEGIDDWLKGRVSPLGEVPEGTKGFSVG
jgi:penicillin amidase